MPVERSNCPISGKAAAQIIVQIPYARLARAGWVVPESFLGLDYILQYAPGSGLYFQCWAMTEQEAADFYNRWQHETPNSYHAKPLSLREIAHRAEEAMIARQLFPDRRPRVLDYGSGDGRWAMVAAGYDCDVTATDVGARAREVAQARGIRWMEPDQLPADHFDFVNADTVFEHLSDPVQVLRRVADAMAPGGVIKISTPKQKNIRARFQGKVDAHGQLLESQDCGSKEEERESLFYDIEPLIHLNLFNCSSLQALAAAAGLEPFRVSPAMSYRAMTYFGSLRQWNRNLYQPIKRWLARGTWQFFRKSG